jgi:hypothetical protein
MTIEEEYIEPIITEEVPIEEIVVQEEPIQEEPIQEAVVEPEPLIDNKQYKMVNGIKMELSEEDYAQRELDRIEWELKKKPIASGKSLVSFIEKAFLGQPFQVRVQLQTLFFPLKLTLESETCQPLREIDFNDVLSFVSNNENLTPIKYNPIAAIAKSISAINKYP